MHRTARLSLLAGVLAAACVTFFPSAVRSQEAPPEESFFAPPPGEGSVLDRVHFSGWVNLNYRYSQDHQIRSNFPFPTPQFLRTPDPGTSFEASDVTLIVDVDVSESIIGRLKLDVIDLYDRNPTSTDYLLDVDEVWLRFGKKYESRELPPGSSFYLLAGKAPKFEKQMTRHLESYGLVATAMNRFEDLQLQIGGSFGQNLYWRAQVSNGNPLFMRDPNALAGDNGTTMEFDSERDLGTGFPILYDAEVELLNRTEDTQEVGGGMGLRFGDEEKSWAIDMLGFYYQRELADTQTLHGTEYGGDLDILSAGPYSLPFDGRRKTEAGGNLDLKVFDFGLWGQFVRQDIAGLVRTGWEAELYYRIDLPPALAIDGLQLFTYLKPVVRYSELDNDFSGPRQFPSPSFWWDWTKLDVGLRVGLLRGLDFTLEWARQDIEAKVPFELDEYLATLHLGF